MRLNRDIELNPGPKSIPCKIYSTKNCNLKSTTSHDFVKVKLSIAYISLYSFDIVCISESYLSILTWVQYVPC